MDTKDTSMDVLDTYFTAGGEVSVNISIVPERRIDESVIDATVVEIGRDALESTVAENVRDSMFHGISACIFDGFSGFGVSFSHNRNSHRHGNGYILSA